MTLKLTPQFILTFLCLTFVMHEAHEIVHTSIGRLICGCWGQRDFNMWELCEGCSKQNSFSIIATFAGPIFTFIMIWIGKSLIENTKTDKQKSLGFALIFANMPFARILTASMGGGDEVFGINLLLKNHTQSWIIGLLFILLITYIPLYKAFKIIQNKRKIGLFLLFLIVPIIIDLLWVLGVLNTLLEKKILSHSWILGSPTIVTIWTIFITVMYWLTRKNIYTLQS